MVRMKQPLRGGSSRATSARESAREESPTGRRSIPKASPRATTPYEPREYDNGYSDDNDVSASPPSRKKSPTVTKPTEGATSSTMLPDLNCETTISAELRCACFVNNRDVWAGEWDGSITMRELSTGSVIGRIPFFGKQGIAEEYCWCMVQVDDTVWAGYSSGRMRVFKAKVADMPSHSVVRDMMIVELHNHSGGVYDMVLKDNHVFTASNDFEVMMWCIEKRVMLQLYSGHKNQVRCLSVAEDFVVSGSDDHTVRVFDLESANTVHILQGHSSSVTAVCTVTNYSREGETLGTTVWSASDDAKIKLWDLQTGKLLKTLSGHKSRIASMTYLDGFVYSAGVDRTIHVWKASTGALLRVIASSHAGYIGGLPLLGHRKQHVLWSLSGDKTVKIWSGTTAVSDENWQSLWEKSQREIARLQDQIDQLTGDLAEKDAMLARLRKDADNLSRRRDSALGKTAGLGSHVEALEARNMQLEAELYAERVKNEKLTEENEDLQRRLAEAARENEALLNELDEMDDALLDAVATHEKRVFAALDDGRQQLLGEKRRTKREKTPEAASGLQKLQTMVDDWLNDFFGITKEASMRMRDADTEVRELRAEIEKLLAELTSEEKKRKKAEDEANKLRERADENARLKAELNQLKHDLARALADLEAERRARAADIEELANLRKKIAEGEEELYVVMHSRLGFVTELWGVKQDIDAAKTSAQNLALVKVRKSSRAIKDAVEEDCLAVNEMINTARVNMREILATYLTEDEKLHLGIPTLLYAAADGKKKVDEIGGAIVHGKDGKSHVSPGQHTHSRRTPSPKPIIRRESPQ